MQPAGRTLVRSAGFVAAPLVGVLLILSIVGSYSPDLSLLLLFLFAFVGDHCRRCVARWSGLGR